MISFFSSLINPGKIFFLIEKNPGNIKKLLQNVLSQDEFSQLRPSQFSIFIKNLVAQISQWGFVKYLTKIWNESGFIKTISKTWTDFLNHAEKLFSNPSTMTVLFVIALIILIAITILIVFNITKRMSLKLAVNKPDSTNNGEFLDPDIQEKEAEFCASKGEFTDAIRHLYISLLLYLTRNGIIHFSSSRTNRETMRLIEQVNMPDLIRYFKQMSSVFEEKVYALRPTTGEDYLNFKQLYFECRKGVSGS
jgi:hypothetical protein